MQLIKRKQRHKLIIQRESSSTQYLCPMQLIRQNHQENNQKKSNIKEETKKTGNFIETGEKELITNTQILNCAPMSRPHLQ